MWLVFSHNMHSMYFAQVCPTIPQVSLLCSVFVDLPHNVQQVWDKWPSLCLTSQSHLSNTFSFVNICHSSAHVPSWVKMVVSACLSSQILKDWSNKSGLQLIHMTTNIPEIHAFLAPFFYYRDSLDCLRTAKPQYKAVSETGHTHSHVV